MNTYTPPKSAYIPVVSKRTGRLLFKIDMIRGIIEVQERGIKEYVDLGALAEGEHAKPNSVVQSHPGRFA